MAATRAYGAEVVQHGTIWDEANELARRLVAERGLTYIHPFDDLELIPARFFVVGEKIGGHLLAAYDGTSMVGFVFGLPAVRGGRFYIHSHMLAVKRSHRNFDLGYRLKLAQRERVAELNLIAGRRAKLATAYDSALKYLRAGRALLSEETWKRNQQLIFSIEYLTAECELLNVTVCLAAGDPLAVEVRHAWLPFCALCLHSLYR